MLDIKFMQKMSFKTRKAYVDHIFEKGKDVVDHSNHIQTNMVNVKGQINLKDNQVRMQQR